MNKKESVAMLSVVSNTCLTVFKLIVGLLIGSVSVISEAIHSGVDLVAAVIAYFAVKTSGKPADTDHSYGHGKYENLSGTIEALLIFVAAGWIIFEAVHKLINPQPMETVGLGIIIMTISAIVNIIVSNRLFKVGKETDSLALQADAWHLKTDVYTSFGVAGGLLIFTICHYLFPQYNLYWIDPVVAILVACLIIKAAWDLTSESIGGLLDSSLPEDEMIIIKNVIDGFNIAYHDLKTRKSGADRFIELHIVVDPNMKVCESHKLSDDIVDKISEHLKKCQITIHVDCENDSK